tara:strand:+ start:588 stop:1133 length:546 start_codon:yes stop_codon:yes gene_type:complete
MYKNITRWDPAVDENPPDKDVVIIGDDIFLDVNWQNQYIDYVFNKIATASNTRFLLPTEDVERVDQWFVWAWESSDIGEDPWPSSNLTLLSPPSDLELLLKLPTVGYGVWVREDADWFDIYTVTQMKAKTLSTVLFDGEVWYQCIGMDCDCRFGIRCSGRTKVFYSLVESAKKAGMGVFCG